MQSKAKKAQEKEHNKEPKKGYKTLLWAIGLTIWVGVAFFAAQLIVVLVTRWLAGVFGFSLESTVTQTVSSAFAYILALAIIVLVPKKVVDMKTTRGEIGVRGLPTWTDILLSIVGYIVSIIVSILIVAMMPGVDWGQEQDVGYSAANVISNMDRIITFVALAVLAPIAEELIFRGFLYGKLRSRLNAFWAILLVSVLFGFMHGQWNVAIIVGIMSVFMCLAREITGTIYAGILMHMIRNGIAFYALFVWGGGSGIGATLPLLAAFLL